jgi:hypothetical protein
MKAKNFAAIVGCFLITRAITVPNELFKVNLEQNRIVSMATFVCYGQENKIHRVFFLIFFI